MSKKKMSGFFSALSRKKTVQNVEESKLARVLNLVDLTALGVGSTLGLGVYVLAGSVAKTVAGPAVCLSFLVAAIASAVAGFCYAEFAARVPKAGSAYVYSYVTVGEIIAFIIGWNLILEYVIGTASVGSGLSQYINSLCDKQIELFFQEHMPMNVSFLAAYPDFLALAFVLLLTGLLSSGVKESTMLNNIFTVLNLITIGIVLVSGAIKADPNNWKIPESEVPKISQNQTVDYGKGGFAPFGISGIMAGAATCFYGFVGFDAVATTGEEAKNPKKNIPLSIVISLIVIFLSYFSISTVLTMMVPYYDQDDKAPFPYVYERLGWTTIKWIVTTGAIFALMTSLLGAMFPLPRVIYAMSSDGLIFRWLAAVNPKTKTPVIATVISGCFAGLMATVFNLKQLIDMMSIGTLLAYTIVAVCILLLRYKPDDKTWEFSKEEKQPRIETRPTALSVVQLLFNLNMNKYPTKETSMVVNWCIALFSVFSAGFTAFLARAIHFLSIGELTYLIPFCVTSVMMLITLTIIARQPTSTTELTFKVPWIPFIPCASVVMNLYLMMELDSETWVRFIVWLIVGFIIYFCYGMRNSEEKQIRLKLKSDRNGSSVTTASFQSQPNGVDKDKQEKQSSATTKF